ncbi:MAG: hypothetical protein UD961_04985 [Bacteroidales bacterium]|nr:hypothetical protein [Bacteroidales bacterium]
MAYRVYNLRGYVDVETSQLAAQKGAELLCEAQMYTEDKSLWWSIVQDRSAGLTKVLSSMVRGQFKVTHWLNLKL